MRCKDRRGHILRSRLVLAALGATLALSQAASAQDEMPELIPPSGKKAEEEMPIPVSPTEEMPAPEPAGEHAAPPFLTATLAGFGGFHTYDLQALNETLDLVNREIQGTQGVKYDHISNGTSGGIGLRLYYRDKYMIAGDYEKLFGSSEVGGTVARATVEVPATGWLLSAGIDFVENRRMRIGVAAGVGFYETKAEQSLTAELDDLDNLVFKSSDEDLDRHFELTRVEISGNDVGHHYAAFVELNVSNRIAFHAWLGYRQLKFDELDITPVGFVDLCEGLPAGQNCEPNFDEVIVDVPIIDVIDETGARINDFKSGENTIDMSGFMGRLGITVYLYGGPTGPS